MYASHSWVVPMTAAKDLVFVDPIDYEVIDNGHPCGKENVVIFDLVEYLLFIGLHTNGDQLHIARSSDE